MGREVGVPNAYFIKFGWISMVRVTFPAFKNTHPKNSLPSRYVTFQKLSIEAVSVIHSNKEQSRQWVGKWVSQMGITFKLT